MGTAGPQRWFFDSWSRFYDLPAIQRAVYRPVQDAVLQELSRDPPHRILDVGCGTGVLSARLAAQLEVELICGCDFSFGMLQHASRRGGADWVQADAQTLPVRSQWIDAVVSTESFHWFPDPDAALAEFARVLVRGGRLVVGGVNPRTEAWSRAVTMASGLAREPFHWPTRAEMASKVSHAGLRIVRQRRVTRFLGVSLPTVLTVAVRPT